MNEASQDPIDTMIEFRTKNPGQFRNAIKITKDFEILAKIYQNISLFKAYNHTDVKFIRIANLSKALRSLKAESILMHFTDINLYGVFTPDEYARFCHKVREIFSDLADTEGRYDERDKLPIINIHQLILSGSKQKFVFMCIKEEAKNKLCEHAKKCFGANATHSNSEISVDLVCAGEMEIWEAYSKLCKYIHENDEKNYGAAIVVPLLDDDGCEYRRYQCGDSISALNMEELILALKNANLGSGSININIANQMIVGNGNNKIINRDDQKFSDRYDIAKNWVKNNLPSEREITTEYYQRYSAEAKIPVHEINLEKLSGPKVILPREQAIILDIGKNCSLEVFGNDDA